MKKMIAGFCLCLLSLNAAAQAEATTAKEVMTCMSKVVPGGMVIGQTLRFETVRAGDERAQELLASLFLRVHREGDGDYRSHAVMHVGAPEYLAGSAYLLRESDGLNGEDGMYVYLPSIDRVRQVTGGFGETALMDTKFSYNDFRHWQGLFGNADVSFVGTVDRQGRPTHLLEVRADKPQKVTHDRVRVAVDAAHCLVMEAEFYNNAQLSKRLTVDAEHLRQFGHFWYPVRLTMRDFVNNGYTVLNVERVRAVPNPRDGLFDPARFHRAD
ncbi:outer membrane lipoprotein-sorting protein [Algiphilus sp.]|uniref:outer membrane lipoprotein-sorting protein n=1 Tax=Algiphilus sp. TaxID=1872431 RepID=UPI003B51EBCC